jgi:hypothetical protein
MEQVPATVWRSRRALERLIKALRVVFLCASLLCPMRALGSRGGGHGGGGHGGAAGRGAGHTAGGHLGHPGGPGGHQFSLGVSRRDFSRCVFPWRHHHGFGFTPFFGFGAFGWDYYAYPSWYYQPLDLCSPYYDPECNCYREPIGCEERSLLEPPPPPPDDDEEARDSVPSSH